MRSDNYEKILLAMVLILSISLVSGCIGQKSQNKRTILGFNGEAPLNYTEVMKINETLAREVEKLGYNVTIKNNLDYPPNCEKAISIVKGVDPEDFFRVSIQAYNVNNNTSAKIVVGYRNPHVDDDVLENYTESKVQEIVNVYNLTLDVNTIKWVISYKD